MLLLKALSLLAAFAAAISIADLSENTSDLDRRETYLVEGNATDAALWFGPEDGNTLEARQVNYRCFSTGLTIVEGVDLSDIHASACGYLQGGYATNQEKFACRTWPTGLIRINYACRNTIGGRSHDFAGCVDRVSAITRACKRGGRVNRANWEILVDPNNGAC